MKAFRLAGLLRLRSAQEKQAAADLARRNAERAAVLATTTAAQHQLASHRMPDQGTSATFTASVAARVALVSSAQDALALLTAADGQVTHAELAWQRARLDAKTLEKLEEQHATRERAADLRYEQQLLDEHATTRGARRDPLDGDPLGGDR